MPDTRATEIEQLKQQIAELTNLVRGNANTYQVPDPIKQLSEFSGNKNELIIWLDEVDQLYNTFKVKGQNGAPDSMNAYYVQAIKNKIKGEARQTLCVNGNPTTIPEIRKVLLQHYGDQKDIATNINLLFNAKKGEKTHQRFYNEIKDLESRIKSNLQINPLSSTELLERIVITKYLDNIQEPLASIIRSTNPSNLEEAFQSVTINQNAETRRPFPKNKPPALNKYSGNNGNYSGAKQGSNPNQNKSRPSVKFVQKPSTSTFHPNRRLEVNTNLVQSDEESDDNEYNDQHDDGNVDSREHDLEQQLDADELNFQTVRLKREQT